MYRANKKYLRILKLRCRPISQSQAKPSSGRLRAAYVLTAPPQRSTTIRAVSRSAAADLVVFYGALRHTWVQFLGIVFVAAAGRFAPLVLTRLTNFKLVR